MTHKKVEKYILSMPGAKLDYPFGKGVGVYKVIPTPDVKSRGVRSKKINPDADGQGRMFALVKEGSDPIQLSLKCDPLLAETLRAKYESVLAGYHLNKKHWNTILLTGQLSWDEIKDLIRHSYNLVSEK